MAVKATSPFATNLRDLNAKNRDTPVKTGKGWRHRYGITLTNPLVNWQFELFCWRNKIETGYDPFYHFKRACEILFPTQQWHEWREQRFMSLCDEENWYKIGKIRILNMSWVGPGASGKTYDAACFAYLFWLAAPKRSYVIMTSTSKNKMKQRAWPIIQECDRAAKLLMDEQGIIGPHMLNSTMELQAEKGDSKHAIFGQAIEAGEVPKAVNNLLGVHAERIMVIIDEAPGTPEAIFRTIPNMLKGCSELILVSIGNGPTTHIDPFSDVCTPVGGWKSVSVESERWKTRPVPKFQLPSGLCLHFDGKKSPNVMAGRTLYPFIYTWENWLRVKDNPDAQRTAEFWSQDRGFWPPEGFLNTVLTEELIEQGNARGEIVFAGETTPTGSIDSGFGGDQCTLRFGRRGRQKNGKMALQIDTRIIVPILVDAIDAEGKKIPAEYQICAVVRREADARGVKPGDFGVEATGTGRGVAAVLTQEWGEVIWIESGGKPTDMRSSEEDDRPANQVYDRKITELWFSVRAFVVGKQLGGLAEDDVIQFCARTYEYEGKKYKLEKKEDLRPRLGRSPDDADAIACLVHVARMHGMETMGPRAERMLSMWEYQINQQQKLLEEGEMYQPEEIPMAEPEGLQEWG